ncbi:MAG: hypothetical protein OXD35_11265, partial [Thiotrichales bacterium]|nr:hypothetical protein [Thiotrichales bacterium]
MPIPLHCFLSRIPPIPMAQPALDSTASTRSRATYQDVLDAPRHRVAQILDGVLHTHPRPA